VMELIEAVAARGRTGGPTTAAMFTRTVPNATATREYRELLVDEGWRVLRATVGNLQRFAQAFGGTVERASATAYGDALTELQS
jgi:chromosome partitioning protein